MRIVGVAALTLLALTGCDGVGKNNQSGSVDQPTGSTSSSAERMNAIRAALVARNFGEAATLARSLVNDAPGDPEAQLLLARAEALLGNIGNAVESLDRAVTAGLANPVEALADPAFSSMRNDSRFVALSARVQPAPMANAPALPKQRATTTDRPEVEISTRDGEDYIRAGDVVIDGNF